MSKSRLRILFTIPNFITAGSGRVLANIVARLNPERFKPSLCVSKKGGRIEAELETLGIDVLEMPFTVEAKPYLGLWGRAQSAAKAFKPYKFDLWHSFHYADDYTEPIIAKMAGAKAWVYTKKSMMWGSNAWNVRSLLASEIIVDNQDMLEMFFNKFGFSKKVHVIPHGIDLHRFKPLKVDKPAYRNGMNLTEDTILVGLVAHLVPVKGHKYLIDAAAQCEGIHLVFAGRSDDGAYFSKLKTQAQSLGLSERIHFLGNVTDVPAFLAQMDIIALPTKKRGEGCPVSLLEAMACGKACIATDVPGSRDIIEDGVSGLLVPPEDPTALAGAIGRLRDDLALRERFGAEARKRVESLYTIEREVAAHERLYLELIAGSG